MSEFVPPTDIEILEKNFEPYLGKSGREILVPAGYRAKYTGRIYWTGSSVASVLDSTSMPVFSSKFLGSTATITDISDEDETQRAVREAACLT